MRLALPLALALLAGAAEARNLCGVAGREEVLAAIAGTWEAEEAISLESETRSLMRHPARATEVVTAEGRLETGFLEDIAGGSVALGLAEPPPYDVDRVDDVLETTESAGFADPLSETRCGPKDLPQLVATLDMAEAEGTVTLIAYFDDRMLRITEFTLRGEGAVIFMSAAALLTRAE